MSNLIRVETNEQGSQVVDARELHLGLQVGRRFDKWISKVLVNSPYFAENEDYVRLSKNGHSKSSQNAAVDYAVTLDTAKKLSMGEDTAKGHEVKDYFLSCERKVQQVQHNLPSTFSEALRLLADSTEVNEQLVLDVARKTEVITKKLEIIEEQDEIIDELEESNFVKEQIIGGGLEPQDYALRINGANSRQINNFLLDIRWQRKVNTYDTPEVHVTGYMSRSDVRNKFLTNKRKHQDYVKVVCRRKVGVMLTELGAEVLYKMYLAGGKKSRGVWYDFPMLKTWDGKFTRPRLED